MRHLDAAALRQRLPWPALVRALRDAFAADAPAYQVPQRHQHALGDAGSVLLMPAWREGRWFGIKTVTVFPGNGAVGLPGVHATYALFDARTGVPVATLDGSELTALRTAAASALAASFLARRDARRLLVVGAGRVAALVPPAMHSVRPSLSAVTVWNRHAEGAERLASSLRAQGWVASATTDLAAAVREADIVSCATLSTAALVQGAWLAPGAHLDLIGGYTPSMREADGECMARGRVWVDTPEALAKAGDLLQAAAEGHFDPGRVAGTLRDLCRGDRPGRGNVIDPGRDISSDAQITVFKSVGTALEDLAAAELACAGPDNPPLTA